MQEPAQKQKRSSQVIFSPTKQPSDIVISCHVTQKLGNSNVLYCKTKKPVKLNICNVEFLEGLLSNKAKKSKGLVISNFEIRWRHMQAGNTLFLGRIATDFII